MRSLLLAVLFPITIGCGNKTDGKPAEAVKPSGAPTAMSVEGSSPGSAVGSGSADKLTLAPPPAGYTGGSAAQDEATEVEQAKSVAKSEADTKQEGADANAVKAHRIVGDQLQLGFDASDRKFSELKEKAANATGTKKKKADVAIADITKREATVMAGIAKLRDASVAVWDKTKAEFDADSAGFNKAIGALEITLR